MNHAIAFNDKVVLVTGAAGGIGHASAQLFDRLGARLVLTDLAGEAFQSLVREFGGTSQRHLAESADLTRSSEIERVVSRCRDEYGRLDCIVASAGVFPKAPIEQITDSKWREVLAINLDSIFFLVRASVPLLSDGSSIVNVASVAAHRGSKDYCHYATSKAGVLGLTRSLARELASNGIRVNAVAPGIIETKMTTDLLSTRRESLHAETPMGRHGSPHEVATAIAFLCSDWASFITGETMNVNGGFHMS